MSRSKIISLNVFLKTSQHRMGKTIVEPGMPTIMPRGGSFLAAFCFLGKPTGKLQVKCLLKIIPSNTQLCHQTSHTMTMWRLCTVNHAR